MAILRLGKDVFVRFEFIDSADYEDSVMGRLDGSRQPPAIQVSRDISGCTLLDTIIHEATHQLCPYLDEDAVTDFATAMARFLWELGYRTDEDGLKSRL